MYETFRRKLVMVYIAKDMILSVQQEIDRLNKRKAEILVEHLDAFTSIIPCFKECQRLNDEFEEITKKLEYAISKKERMDRFVFRRFVDSIKYMSTL